MILHTHNTHEKTHNENEQQDNLHKGGAEK